LTFEKCKQYDIKLKKNQYKYILGDSEEIISTLTDNKFKLIITSPPYNLGKEYENHESISNYLATQKKIIGQLITKLHPEGSICWQVGNYVNNFEVYPLDILYYQIFKEFGLKLRNRIVWHFRHGLNANNRFSGRYETILWFSKGDKFVFNLDDVRIDSRYPGKKHYKGKNKGLYSGHPKGKNPSDVWEVLLRDWEREIWDIPNVKANHIEKTEHPCQYPIELVERCILALTNLNDWILDPFAGAGSTVLAGLMNGRNVVAIERMPGYIEIGEKRIQQFRNNELRYREMTKEIYDHTKSKLSIKPEQFSTPNTD
jgi:DNA modification methylase